MGDLPRPDQDVLSETLWNAQHSSTNLLGAYGISSTNLSAMKPPVPSSTEKSQPLSNSIYQANVHTNLTNNNNNLSTNINLPWNPLQNLHPQIASTFDSLSRKRSEETMSASSNNNQQTRGIPIGIIASTLAQDTKSNEGVHYAKKLKLEKE